MDLSNTIIPKSDQLNADDLITGPRTIKITAIEAGSAEQPVTIRYEGDNGRPYKPGKSMRRVLVALYGGNGNAYKGKSLTLYADPSVRFGGVNVGGIRISHASHIDQPTTLMLTETRGKKKPFTVQPLKVAEVAAKAVQAQAAAPDGSLDEAIFAAEAIGETKAREGMNALKAWFTALPSGVKVALKAKLDNEWKPLTEGVK